MEIYKVLCCLFIVLGTVSCSDDESTVSSPDTQEPLVVLQYTNAPINIEGTNARFSMDVSYDQYDKTKFNIFLPDSSTPTGLVIFIHGGGFTGGDKAFIYNSTFESDITELLNNGVAVATINYRLLETGDTEGVLKKFE